MWVLLILRLYSRHLTHDSRPCMKCPASTCDSALDFLACIQGRVEVLERECPGSQPSASDGWELEDNFRFLALLVVLWGVFHIVSSIFLVRLTGPHCPQQEILKYVLLIFFLFSALLPIPLLCFLGLPPRWASCLWILVSVCFCDKQICLIWEISHY